MPCLQFTAAWHGAFQRIISHLELHYWKGGAHTRPAESAESQPALDLWNQNLTINKLFRLKQHWSSRFASQTWLSSSLFSFHWHFTYFNPKRRNILITGENKVIKGKDISRLPNCNVCGWWLLNQNAVGWYGISFALCLLFHKSSIFIVSLLWVGACLRYLNLQCLTFKVASKHQNGNTYIHTHIHFK